MENSQNWYLIKSDDIASPANSLAKQINLHLEQGEAVFWLTSGGSCTNVAVKTRNLLGEIRGDLTFSLVDERFGEPEHINSNWHNLEKRGFHFDGVHAHPVLTGRNIQETTQDYDLWLTETLKKSDFTIGLFGMGSDGHTAGLKPENPIMDSQRLADSYTSEDFERITATPKLIQNLDEVVLFAVDNEKWPAFEKLLTGKQIPAHVLLEAKKLSVYTDYAKE